MAMRKRLLGITTLLGLLAPIAGYARRRGSAIEAVAFDLRHPFLWVPLRVNNLSRLHLIRRVPLPRSAVAPGVTVTLRSVPGSHGAPDVEAYLYEPPERRLRSGALLWIHGGGYIMGSARDYHGTCSQFARELGILVVSVEYRLAPEHPFPAGLEDCDAVLHWLFDHADELNIDRQRVAVGGDSAGGGMAAALAQLSYDRGECPLRFQLLIYPMLDDRTMTTSGEAGHGVLIWDAPSNRFAWNCYLGDRPPTTPHAVPARRDDLTGLPPAWIGVGTLDLFHDEDVRYARRLQEAGVSCEMLEVPGMYHGGDTIPAARSTTARAFTATAMQALRRAIG